MQPINARSDDDPINEGKIGRWFSQWRQHRKIKARWYRQPRQLYEMLELRTIYCLAMSYSIIKNWIRHFW